MEVFYGDVRGTSMGRLRNTVSGRPQNQMIGRSRDIRGTLAKKRVSDSSLKYNKLTLTGYCKLNSEGKKVQ